MVNAALAFQSTTNSTTDLVIVAIGLTISLVIAGVLLARQRSRVKPEGTPDQPAPRLLSGRQRKVISKLEPVPELPTLMDLVREEIEEAGLRDIPGHEELPEHIMLKVFRRDEAVIDRCTHGEYQFVLAEGVVGADALETDVKLLCEQCGPAPASEPGTNLED